MRAGTVLSLVATVFHFYDQRNREVKPNRIYNSAETARLLGVDRGVVVGLLKSGKLNGQLVKGNFRVPGLSILEYLQNEK